MCFKCLVVNSEKAKAFGSFLVFFACSILYSYLVAKLLRFLSKAALAKSELNCSIFCESLENVIAKLVKEN